LFPAWNTADNLCTSRRLPSNVDNSYRLSGAVFRQRIKADHQCHPERSRRIRLRIRRRSRRISPFPIQEVCFREFLEEILAEIP